MYDSETESGNLLFHRLRGGLWQTIIINHDCLLIIIYIVGHASLKAGQGRKAGETLR